MAAKNNAQGTISCQQLSFGRIVRETKTTNTITVTTFDDGQPDSFESAQAQNAVNFFPQAPNNSIQQLPPALAMQLLIALQQVKNFFRPRESQPAQQLNYVA